MSAATHTAQDGGVVDGPVPKHAQLREILRHAVERDMAPGTPIPSERELAEHYRVSRLTVRSAVGKLVEEGLLARVRGKGTFAAHERMELELYLMSFTNDMRQRGLEPATEVLRASVETPPPTTAKALQLPLAQPAYRVARLRKANTEPLAVEHGWYHPGRIPALLELDLTQSLYEQLARLYSIRLDHAWQTVWAQSADDEAAQLLGVRVGSPLLAFRRISSVRGEPVEDMTSWYRGDQYQLTTQLDHTAPGVDRPDPSDDTRANQGGTR